MRLDNREWYRGGGLVAIFVLNLTVFTPAAVGQEDSHSRTDIAKHYERGQSALRDQRFDAAAAEFEEILKLNPKSSSAYANIGMIKFRQGNYDAASTSFSAALRIDPSLWDAKAFLGLSQARLGHKAEARQLLDRALPHVQNPTLRIQAGLDLIRIAQETASPDGAIDVIRKLEQTNPDDPEVLYAAYRVYSDLAARSVSQLSKIGPNSARLHQILAQAALSQDDVAAAIAEYRIALKLEPALPGAHYELGRAVLQQSQEESSRDEAQAEFESELSINPNDAHSEYELGQLYSFRSNSELALQHYTRSLQLKPNYVDAHLALGKLLDVTNRPDEAFRHYQEAARLDPESEVAHYRLSQAYRKMGRIEEANDETAIFQKLKNAHLPARSAETHKTKSTQVP